MLIIKEANFEDIEKEWALVRDMPLDENGCINSYHGVKRQDFDKAVYSMIESKQGINLPEGFVPDTTLFVWMGDKPIGLFRVRHYLNDSLRTGSGHIGYWIAPQYRGKGYATEALALVMKYAAKIIDEDEFYLRVDKTNPASLRVMEKNGGKIVSEDDKKYYVRIPKPEIVEEAVSAAEEVQTVQSAEKISVYIREMKPEEYPLLNEFLYQAIFVPEGVEPPPREIIEQPDLQVYVKDFGTHPHDGCLVAEYEGKVIGAVWVRDMPDYGHIRDGEPSFAIAVLKEYRGHGIGTQLMERMLGRLTARGYANASLAVQKANYAVRMYRNVGFVVVGENEEEFIMEAELGNN